MGESCFHVCTVRCWIWQFKQEVGEEIMCDTARLERPLTATGQNKKPVKSWQKYIEVGGDYVEK